MKESLLCLWQNRDEKEKKSRNVENLFQKSERVWWKANKITKRKLTNTFPNEFLMLLFYLA